MSSIKLSIYTPFAKIVYSPENVPMILPVVLHFGTRNDLVVTFRLVVVVVVLHIGSYVCASK